MNAALNDKLILKSSWIGTRPRYIFGPCGAESRDQVMETAAGIANNFDHVIFRAGVWKPRTRPGSFEGAGDIALEWLIEVKKEFGFETITEVANSSHVEACLKAGIDNLWIGARTTVNPFSVQEIADALQGADVSVFIKNPIHADFGLWVGAIERIFNAGIRRIAAIHRGFYQSENSPYRNVPNWAIPIKLKRTFPEIPLICDASHISGKPEMILDVAQKAMDLNMDGLMIETHRSPKDALSDSEQQITPAVLNELINDLEIRDADSSDVAFQIHLSELRKNIDETDEHLLEELSKRMELVKEIGRYKRDNNVTILQIKRYEELINRCVKIGLSMGFSETFVERFLDLIHTESIHQQTEVMNQKINLKD